MGRGLTAPMKALLATNGVRPVWFCSIALSPVTYFWTGIGSTTQNDSGGTPRTWLGIGDGGRIDGIGSDDGLTAGGITIELAGIPRSYVAGGVVAATRAVRYQGKAVDVYISAVTDSTGVPALTPEIIWSGFADVMSLKLGQQVHCQLSAEHLTSILRRSANFTMTTESHNTRLGNPIPRDLFYEAQTKIMGMPKPFLDPN